ncbi:hypothetical protein EKN38_21305 [Enterobacter sp. WCHEn045836]|uniref:hypothetical protein n=1 Tax=Enterobacter sp. WCHEn045836 TaxID=2497434 RepID=UPI000F82773D|nr:hypothetical protein [Enterobacter sp. WCHEn045836]RTP98388.1 hypothetical protein EKN38_21305 [Enterobacter sp. WCHEn045836]
MMIKGWISNLLPSLLIGLIVGGAATWQVESSIERQLERSTLGSAVERNRLIRDISVASANELEKRLEELHKNDVTVEKHFTREVIKPVFSNVCASDEYVRLFNESSAAAERALSGQHDQGVPAEPPPVKR